MGKKDIYNAGLFPRTYINGETAIKPYWYLRNGLIHVRYNVDRCIELTRDETIRVKEELYKNPANKQAVLEKFWSFYSDCVEKPIIYDGIAEVEKRIKKAKDGQQN